MTTAPPPDVALAAKKVEDWLQSQSSAQGKVSDEQYARMSPAQKLDYARNFDQSQFTKPAPR